MSKNQIVALPIVPLSKNHRFKNGGNFNSSLRRRRNLPELLVSANPVQSKNSNTRNHTRTRNSRRDRRTRNIKSEKMLNSNNNNNNSNKALLKEAIKTQACEDITEEHILQTLVCPQLGAYRIYDSTFAPTALYMGTLLTTVTATVGNPIVSIAINPMLVANPNMIKTQASTVPVNPQGGAGPATPGPFVTTNPAVQWRTISCVVSIMPTSTIMNRGGAGLIRYDPIGGTNVTWSQTAFQNAGYNYKFDPATPFTSRWIPAPNDRTMLLADPNVYTNSQLSLILSCSTGCTWDISVCLVVEYSPNDIYSPYVPVEESRVMSEAFTSSANKFRDSMIPLMFCTGPAYTKLQAQFGVLSGGWSHCLAVDPSGLGAGGGAILEMDGDRDEDAEDEQLNDLGVHKTDLLPPNLKDSPAEGKAIANSSVDIIDAADSILGVIDSAVGIATNPVMGTINALSKIGKRLR